MWKKLFVLLFLLVLGTTTTHAYEDWVIENFDVEMKVHNDGWVDIVETIEVDFGELQKHGIFRDIPVEYQDEYLNKLSLEYQVEGVRDAGGQEWEYHESKQGRFLRLKIGDPDVYVSGVQTYQIHYRVRDAINFFDSHDELFWNVTGNGWPVPIDSATARVMADRASIESSCFTGNLGSVDEDCQIGTGDGDLIASVEGLDAGEGLTIVAGYPVGTVGQPTAWEVWSRRLRDNWGYLLPVLTLMFLLRQYAANGRDEYYRHGFGDDKNNATIPMFAANVVADRYYPPENISTAEAGVIVDEKVHSRDIAAVLIGLAEKGYMKVIEKKKGKYSFKKLKSADMVLRGYEKTLLDGLFDVKDEVTLSSLKYKFNTTAKKVTDELYQEIKSQGYFVTRPDKVRQRYLALGGVIITFGMFALVRGLNGAMGVSLGIGVILSGVLFMIFSRSMPKRTAQGRQALMEVLGLKRVIKLGDYRQQMFERNNYVTEILPYAIAFGLTKQWAKAVEKLQIDKPDWYQGYSRFSPAIFSSSMNSLSRSSASTMTAVKSSASSGSSGFSGGSSGGGFGGGGGGSW